ncbi:MAG: AAA family ATPase, partial [Patescibacteria group bacterium]
MGLRNPNRPTGSFLFLGPSGVGKTETCKVLAKTVYGSERSFTRIDMSEFSEQHTVQRLIGAPPGYIGFETGGQLTNAISEQPYSLILLDEIEKAHPKIFDIFLQVFDDGRLTDGQGKTVNFTNSIVISTSNL